MTMTGRDTFLQRVRQAVRDGNRAGEAPTAPDRGSVGYQGAGADLLGRFMAELTQAGGHAHRVADRAAAIEQVLARIQDRNARKVLLGGRRMAELGDLAERLRGLGVEVATVEALTSADRDTFFAADAGVAFADHLIAESGTVVVRSGQPQPRSLTLVPPLSIVVAEANQVLPDLFDLFGALPANDLPACVSLITGPSKTGDIELTLVTGVHGPGELHVILIAP